MRNYLLYLHEDTTIEVKADTYRHEETELVFSLDGEVVARFPSTKVLCIDEIKPDGEQG
jgi:hypothetical protein